MKKLFSFVILILVVFFAGTCDVPAQAVDIQVNYTVTVNDIDGMPIDSAKIILWKGNNTTQCPLEEDMQWSDLDVTGLTVVNIPVPSSQYTFNLSSAGEWIKVGLVQFSGGWSSDMATSSFINLPKKPRKVQIINVTIIPR